MTTPVVHFTLLKSIRVPSGVYQAKDLEALAHYVLGREGVKGPVELSLDLTGHKRIHELNRRFRGVDRTTDVISFRNDSGPWPVARGREKNSPFGSRGTGHGSVSGDLAINVVQAGVQAQKMKHPTRREVRLLLIHGILHLLGYTDYEPVPRRRMFKRQNALLLGWERRHR